MIQASAELHRQLDGLVVAPDYERRLRVLLEHCERNLPSVDEGPVSYTHLTLPTNREV